MKKCYLLLVIVFMVFSCNPDGMFNDKIVGNGVLQDKEVTVTDFENVELNGAYEVYFVQDSLTKVELEGESNILPFINIFNSGNRLIIENKEGVSFELNFPIKVTIHHSGATGIVFNGAGLINLGYFESSTLTSMLSGAGSITGNIKSSQIDFILSGSGNVDANVSCDELEASVSGQGNFNFEGTASRGVFSVSGVGNIDALKLDTEKVWCTISGVGDSKFRVSDELHANISGAGNIYYMGSPELDVVISGTGSVVKL